MWEKKEGVFQQPLDAACFNLADNIKTVLELRKQNVQLNVSFMMNFLCKTLFWYFIYIFYLEWQLRDDLCIFGDRWIFLCPIVKLLSRVEDELVDGDACHMAATRSGKNCSAHA